MGAFFVMQQSFGESWLDRQVLVTVKAYPEPSQKYGETVCVAGTFCDTLEPVRIYPVRFRLLPRGYQFPKYSIITARMMKATSDARRESFRINHDAQIHVGPKIQVGPERDRLLSKWSAASIEDLKQQQSGKRQVDAPSLALIRPREITKFSITALPVMQQVWSDNQRASLAKMRMFERSPSQQLERIPFEFRYQFVCDDANCRGHSFKILDWEAGAAYRNFQKYGDGWQEKMNQKFWDDLVLTKDLQFYVGTISNHPHIWSIIGLYYPSKRGPASFADMANAKLPGFE